MIGNGGGERGISGGANGGLNGDASGGADGGLNNAANDGPDARLKGDASGDADGGLNNAANGGPDGRLKGDASGGADDSLNGAVNGGPDDGLKGGTDGSPDGGLNGDADSNPDANLNNDANGGLKGTANGNANGNANNAASRGASGFATLFYKEVLRFWKVAFQTVLAPVITALLYLTIFGHALRGHVQVYPGVDYTSFLIPGLVMMSVLQNAFANSSSSLIQSKITGNLVFVLLTPLSARDMYGAYVLASMVRALVVGACVLVVTVWFVSLDFAAPLYIVAFAFLGSAILGTLGLIAGILAEKFDQLAAFQNFLIMPLTFLSGVFYSTHTLPPVWREVSRLNPFFYMIDGFRYGFFGLSDIDPRVSLAIVGGFFVALAALAMRMLASGYRLRH